MEATTCLFNDTDGLDEETDRIDELEEDLADACTSMPPHQPSHRIEANIAWHASYQVPVMLFRVYTRDGSMLGALQSTTLLFASRSDSEREPTEFVTQEEHPVTSKPWLMLHPCQTRERMLHVLFPASASSSPAETDAAVVDEWYLLRWLAMVGPVVHITVPPHAYRDAQMRLHPQL